MYMEYVDCYTPLSVLTDPDKNIRINTTAHL